MLSGLRLCHWKPLCLITRALALCLYVSLGKRWELCLYFPVWDLFNFPSKTEVGPVLAVYFPGMAFDLSHASLPISTFPCSWLNSSQFPLSSFLISLTLVLVDVSDALHIGSPNHLQLHVLQAILHNNSPPVRICLSEVYYSTTRCRYIACQAGCSSW